MIINTKYPALVFLLLVIMAIVGNAHAAPYQFQVTGSYAQAKSEFGVSEDVDSDVSTFGLTYYLRPVDATTGPLSERAFLSKSAWLSGTYRQQKDDFADADQVKSTIVTTRFVTQTDIIVEFDYLKIDDDDDATYSFGLGRYLDSSTTAILKISHSDDDLNVLSLTYRKLAHASTAFSGVLGYIDTKSNSIDRESIAGYQIAVNGTHYFSTAFSVGAGMQLQKIRRSNSATNFLTSEYFLTESIYGGITYSQSLTGGSQDTTSFALSVGARF